MQLSGLEVELMEVEVETAKFDVVLRAIERERGLELRLQYRTDLFESTTIDQLMEKMEASLSRD